MVERERKQELGCMQIETWRTEDEAMRGPQKQECRQYDEAERQKENEETRAAEIVNWGVDNEFGPMTVIRIQSLE